MASLPTQATQGTSEYQTEDLNTLGDDELRTLLENRIKQLSDIEMENRFVEGFLQKNDPELLVGITKEINIREQLRIVQFAAATANTLNTVPSVKSKEIFSRSASRLSVMNSTSKLSVMRSTSKLSVMRGSSRSSLRSATSSQASVFGTKIQVVKHNTKVDMIEKQCAEIRTGLNTFEKKHKLILRDAEATLIMNQMMKNVISNTVDDFQKQFLIYDAKQMREKIFQEEFTKFIDKWMKDWYRMVDKTRMLASSMKDGCIQAIESISKKMEFSQILRPVDFEQLQIDKDNYVELLNEANAQFLALKKAISGTTLSLAQERKVTADGKDNLVKQKSDISAVAILRNAISVKKTAIEAEVKNCEEKIRSIQELKNSNGRQNVSDYIEKKEKLRLLKARRKQF